MRCPTALCMLVEAARARAGPATQAVWEMGSPPQSLPPVVARRIQQRVTGAEARTDRRSLAAPLSTPTEAASQSRRGHTTRQEGKAAAPGQRMCHLSPVGLCHDIENKT